MKDRNFLVLLIIISLAIKIPIVLFVLNGFGIDESLYLATARDYAETGIFGIKTEFNDFRFVAPLLAFVMSGFYKIFGEIGPLLVSPIAGSLAIIPFYYLGKLAINEKAGKLAAILALVNPAYFLLNTRPLTESIALLLFVSAVTIFLFAIKEKKYWIFILPLLFLTFLARYPYGVILGIFFIITLIIEKKFKLIFNYKMLIGLAITILIALPWLFYNYQSYGDFLGGPAHQGSTDIGFVYERASWYVPYLFMIAGATFPLMIYGLLKNIRERKLVYFLLGFFTIFLIQFFVFGKSVEERYMLPILPFVTILAISGYDHISLKWKKYVKYIFIAMIVINLFVAFYLVQIFSNLPKYSETQEALLWVKENCGPVIMGNVFTPTYNILGKDVVPVTLDPNKDNIVLKERNVDCVIVSLHESPYEDFFSSNIDAEKFSFGKVFIYKVNK